jgi:hypothetical protein
MSDQRDWDKEMAKIDRLMAKDAGAPAERPSEGAVPAGTAGRSPRAATAAAPAGRAAPAVSGARRGFAVWLITLLGPIGAAALTAWPYPKACGPMLAVYLVGVLAVAAASIWAMRTAWLSRRGWALIVAVAALVAALALLAAEVLPRTGYAAQALAWTCST